MAKKKEEPKKTEAATTAKVKPQKVATINGWVARDDNGRLFIYTDKPERKGIVFTAKSGHCAEISNKLFPQITRDNAEATKVELSIVIAKTEKK